MTEKKEERIYTVELMCHSCGVVCRHDVKYGIAWKDVAKCPNCGCGSENLERV